MYKEKELEQVRTVVAGGTRIGLTFILFHIPLSVADDEDLEPRGLTPSPPGTRHQGPKIRHGRPLLPPIATSTR